MPTMDERCLSFATDLWQILRGEQIPSHEHWDENNCNSLRHLIAAFARKHFGDLMTEPAEIDPGEAEENAWAAACSTPETQSEALALGLIEWSRRERAKGRA